MRVSSQGLAQAGVEHTVVLQGCTPPARPLLVQPQSNEADTAHLHRGGLSSSVHRSQVLEQPKASVPRWRDTQPGTGTPGPSSATSRSEVSCSVGGPEDLVP